MLVGGSTGTDPSRQMVVTCDFLVNFVFDDRSGRMNRVHTPATVDNNKNNSASNENNKEAKAGQHSLAGERVHGLPSNTNSRFAFYYF